MKKIFVVLLVIMFCGLVAEGAEIFSSPMDTQVCKAQIPFLKFVKGQDFGCSLGEHWWKINGEPATGEPVYLCAEGMLWAVDTNPETGAETTVFMHDLPDGRTIYSVYGGIESPGVVGEHGSQGEIFGTVVDKSLYFAITTEPWSKDPQWLKKVTLGSLGGYTSPSLLIDLRQKALDLTLPKGEWASFQLGASVPFELGWISWNGDTGSLTEGIAAGCLAEQGKMTDGAGNTWTIELSPGSTPGFLKETSYQFRGLKDGVATHFYWPGYARMDQAALLDMIRAADLYKPYVGAVKPKTFKRYKATDPGYAGYQMKAKSTVPEWGKVITLCWEHNTQHPFQRFFRILDGEGYPLFSWAPWQGPLG